MKKLYTIIVAVIITSNLFGQAPASFKYQAVLRDVSGNVRANADVSIDIAIIQGSASGSQVFIETHIETTNEFGLVNLEIGSKNTIGFLDINWSAGPYFIKVSVDGTEMGTSQLLSVPYALYAKTAENGFSGDYNDLDNKPDLIGWDTDRTDDVTLNEDQTIPGIKSFTGQVIVPEPIDSSDAVTKKYVDGLLMTLSLKGVIAMDYEGNVYPTVRIGSQIWMAENLKTHHYRDGEAIPIILGDHDWAKSTSAVCYENYLGGYYNWYAVESEKLCPTGWSVPQNASWQTLQDYLGGSLAAGPKLKAGTYGGGLESNNESGFTAVAAGVITSGGFGDQVIGYVAGFWSRTPHDSITAGSAGLSGQTDAFMIGSSDKTIGRSVRCIKGYY